MDGRELGRHLRHTPLEGLWRRALDDCTSAACHGPPGPPYTAEDIRFTQKGDVLYAFVGAWPESRVAKIRSLSTASAQVTGARVTNITLLGYGGKLTWTQDVQGLSVNLPETAPSQHAVALKIHGIPPT